MEGEIEVERVEEWASGEVTPEGEEFAAAVAGITAVNSETIAYINHPSDISRVLEIDGEGDATKNHERVGTTVGDDSSTTQPEPEEHTQPDDFI
jgi:hypothetical protein